MSGSRAENSRRYTRVMDDVNGQVDAELALIPSGGFSQNMLRGLYQKYRANVLGANPDALLSPREVLERATARLRKDDPDFEPRYDRRLLDR